MTRAQRWLFSILVLAGFAALVPAGAARAEIVKGTLTFGNLAFADTATLLFGADATPVNAPTVEMCVTGSDLSTYIQGFYDNEIIRITFEDNWIVNEPGDDLVVFEVGNSLSADTFEVAIDPGGGALPDYQEYTPVYQGAIDGAPTNAALVDLTDLGVADDAVVTELLIRSADTNEVELSGVGALHGAPEPATLLLLASGAGLGLRMGRRRRRRR